MPGVEKHDDQSRAVSPRSFSLRYIYIFFGQAGITSCLVVIVVFDPVTTVAMPGPGGWEC